MSYDLHLLPRDKADAFLLQSEEQGGDSLEINPGPVVAEREQWKRQLKDALIAKDPRLCAFPFVFSEIAQIDGISEEEARVRYRHIELNLAENDPTGIQLTLFDETATVTIPYWHEGVAATQVFRQVWDYLAVMERVGELATHDPQIERILDLNTDFEAVVNRYLSVVGRMPEIIAQTSAPVKPWWKFW